MMEWKVGSIAKSEAGHDKGDLLVVTEVTTDGFVFLIDGKSRRMENPKRKNQKHISFVSECDPKITERLRLGEKVLAADIRKILSKTAEEKKL